MIIRADRPESKFYILDKNISEDMRLTWAARGLLIFLLGKPDKWRVSITHLQTLTKNTRKPTKRDGICTLLNELINVGYVRRAQSVDAKGKFLECDYFVYEHPLGTDMAEPDDDTGENPVTAKPVAGKEHENIVKTWPTEDLNEKNPVTANPVAAKPVAATATLVSNDLKLSTDVEEGMSLSKEGENLAPAKPKAEKKAKAKSPVTFNYKNFDFAFALAYLISDKRVNKESSLDGISIDFWNKWMEVRSNETTAKMTERALNACLQDLIEINEAGLNANEAMQEAIKRGWEGLGHWIEKKRKPAYQNNKQTHQRYDFQNLPDYQLPDDYDDNQAIDSTATHLTPDIQIANFRGH